MILRKNLLSNMSSKTFSIGLVSLTVGLSMVFSSPTFSASSKAKSQSISKEDSGKSTALPFLDKMEKPYEYEPIDPDYWSGVEDKLKDENYSKVIEGGLELGEDYGSDSDDALEGLLAVGIALRELKLYFASTLVLKDVALKRISSELAQKALYELSLIDQDSYLDPLDMVDDFLNSNEFGTLHPDVQSFVSYYVSMSDLINGFRDWSKIEASQVKHESYWNFKTQYLKGLNEITQGKLDEAESRLTKITQNEKASERLKKRANLQIARISFEKKNFIKAADIYKELKDFPAREKGRILLERAWSNYYLKNYSESLGILQGLKAPVYMVSVSPERYVLEMIIYKQLCYFEKVSEVAKEYYDVFGKAIKDIKKRKDLKKDTVISQYVMSNMRVQEQANFINQLRDELAVVHDLNLKGYKYFKDIEDRYKNKDQEIQKRLYLQLDQLYPAAAEDILDSEEQVKFLDYTAKLDALRIVRKGEERNYQSQKISYVKFDKVYWPVEEEYWIDELDDYQVLIKSQCDQSLPSSSGDEGIIKQFGEEFK